MSAFSKLAEWLDPSAARTARYNEARLRNAEVALVECRSQIDTLSASNHNIVNKLADAATTITTLRAHRKSLREELIVARGYALDASDDLEDQLEAAAPRSKKRPALQAAIAAVNDDLKRIANLLSETSK